MRGTRLITNADDFGWSRGITDGILLAHREGIVTSTTLMVNQPTSEYALEQASQLPKLGVGVHLHLCDGSPVLSPREVPTLVSSGGGFYRIAELRRRLWRRQVSSDEIQAEFRAQIRWMKDRGKVPTHADSHHHVHFHPFVAGSFRRALLSEGIFRARPPRQQCSPKNGSTGGPHAGPLYRRLFVDFYLRMLRPLALRNLSFPDFRLAIHPSYQGKLDQLGQAWREAIENLPSGTYELECHPGINDPNFPDSDYWRERRELELSILTDPNLRLAIERNGIELNNYSQL